MTVHGNDHGKEVSTGRALVLLFSDTLKNTNPLTDDQRQEIVSGLCFVAVTDPVTVEHERYWLGRLLEAGCNTTAPFDPGWIDRVLLEPVGDSKPLPSSSGRSASEGEAAE